MGGDLLMPLREPRTLCRPTVGYTQMIRPVVEYASAAWDLTDLTQIGLTRDVEIVQRRAARMVTNSCGRARGVCALPV